jgi:hypothetical protein
MYRLRSVICVAFLAGMISGCGDGADSPNATPPEATNSPDFAKKTADMMKDANAGSMDLKKVQQKPAEAPKN